MARRRILLLNIIAAATLVSGAPLIAQATNTTSATPSPAPAGDSIGPPQLRDFNLNGTVTQAPTPAPAPAPTGAPTAAPSTTPRAPSSGNALSAPARPAPGRAPGMTRPAPTPVEPRQPTLAAPDSDPSPAVVTVDLPPASTTTVIPDAGFAPAPVASPVGVIPGERSSSQTAWWPWLAAALALALGAAFLMWRRRQSGAARYATDQADLGALVASPDSAPSPIPRAAVPAAAAAAAAAAPRPRPAEPARPAPSFPAARQPSASAPPIPASIPASVPVPEPISGGIVASGLKPRIEFELVPIRAETDASGGAAVTFDIVVINRGSAPARDVLIEAQLINAGPRVDEEVGQFFMQPAGSGERLPTIPPMGRVSIRTRLAVGGETLSPLVVEGRSLLVPLVAINALYRWSGGELKNSSSFLVGRGDSDEGRMAPFRLDRGARSWSGLAARLHSTGLKPG